MGIIEGTKIVAGIERERREVYIFSGQNKWNGYRSLSSSGGSLHLTGDGDVAPATLKRTEPVAVTNQNTQPSQK